MSRFSFTDLIKLIILILMFNAFKTKRPRRIKGKRRGFIRDTNIVRGV
jgi:hypothetical protein